MPATLNSFFSFLSAIIPIKVQKRARASSNFARNSDKFGRKFGAVGVLGGRKISAELQERERSGEGVGADCHYARFLCRTNFFCCRRSGDSSADFIWRRAWFCAILEQRIRHACYIPNPSFFASASARSRTAFSARSISAFRAAMFSFAIFERSASVYKNAPSKLPHVGSIL